ncbi:hypothetical protein [Rubinisphaera italica]|uniref:hypothetical protein n=1 Tax=Rubinisphaera italica TaxID=2527969 RepID=UPI0013EEF6F5|nr:hypothetical protein [Rubinisphaera italica]
MNWSRYITGSLTALMLLVQAVFPAQAAVCHCSESGQICCANPEASSCCCQKQGSPNSPAGCSHCQKTSEHEATSGLQVDSICHCGDAEPLSVPPVNSSTTPTSDQLSSVLGMLLPNVESTTLIQMNSIRSFVMENQTILPGFRQIVFCVWQT